MRRSASVLFLKSLKLFRKAFSKLDIALDFEKM